MSWCRWCEENNVCQCPPKKEKCKSCCEYKEDMELITYEWFTNLQNWPSENHRVDRICEMLIGMCKAFDIKEIELDGDHCELTRIQNQFKSNAIRFINTYCMEDD